MPSIGRLELVHVHGTRERRMASIHIVYGTIWIGSDQYVWKPESKKSKKGVKGLDHNSNAPSPRKWPVVKFIDQN